MILLSFFHTLQISLNFYFLLVNLWLLPLFLGSAVRLCKSRIHHFSLHWGMYTYWYWHCSIKILLKITGAPNVGYSQRCQLLRITRSHYGKLQNFSVFYGLRKTRVFLRDFFFFLSSNQKCCQKALNKRIWFLLT